MSCDWSPTRHPAPDWLICAYGAWVGAGLPACPRVYNRRASLLASVPSSGQARWNIHQQHVFSLTLSHSHTDPLLVSVVVVVAVVKVAGEVEEQKAKQ